MKREVDVERARIAWNFLQLPYVTRAALLDEFGLPTHEPHTRILPECLDTLKSAGGLKSSESASMSPIPKIRLWRFWIWRRERSE